MGSAIVFALLAIANAVDRVAAGTSAIAGDRWSDTNHERRRRIAKLEHTLGTLIMWIAQSANAPISQLEATTLLQMIDGDGPVKPPGRRPERSADAKP